MKYSFQQNLEFAEIRVLKQWYLFLKEQTLAILT